MNWERLYRRAYAVLKEISDSDLARLADEALEELPHPDEHAKREALWRAGDRRDWDECDRLEGVEEEEDGG